MILQQQTLGIDHIWTEHDHILLFTDHKSTLLRLDLKMGDFSPKRPTTLKI